MYEYVIAIYFRAVVEPVIRSSTKGIVDDISKLSKMTDPEIEGEKLS